MADEEQERQRELLEMPVGIPGSGYARYQAAMYFHAQGRIGDELLEIYRICCKHDGEDPVAVARHEGIDPRFKP
jgi:hypothetical protein